MKNYPFALKELPDLQKKLFRRAHGVKTILNANGNTEIEFAVPYTWAKITTMEIVGLPQMMQADVTIHDNITGTYSGTGISKLQLNKFGFDINIAPNYYKDHSEYDADLYQGMIIKVVIKNNSNLTPEVGINITLHEVV